MIIYIFFKSKRLTLLSSRFCRASFPVLSLISTFLGWVMSVCRSMTLPSLRPPLHADSASKSSVLLSEEPSTGQNMPQNFCLGLAGLSEPMLLKKAGTSSPAVDMPHGVFGGFFLWNKGGCFVVMVAARMLSLSLGSLFLFFFFSLSLSLLSLSVSLSLPQLRTPGQPPPFWPVGCFFFFFFFKRRWSHCDKKRGRETRK